MGSGESIRVTLRCPRFNSQTWCQIWVDFVAGTRPCSERFFFRVLQLSPLLKNQNKYSILSGHCPHTVKSISLSCHGIMCYTNLHFCFTINNLLKVQDSDEGGDSWLKNIPS